MPAKKFLFLFLVLLCAAFQAAALQAAERRTPVVAAVEKALPAVVNIRTEQIVKRSSPFFGFSDPLFEEFFREFAPPRTYTTESLGSGVIIDQQGYVLTNAHVIRKASKIFVALPDDTRELQANLVGVADRVDLAVLRIEGEPPFPFLAPGRSDDLMAGETVIAIGNPLGLGHSITTGVLSGPRRQIPVGNGEYATFLQSDALINPGNSGGPLLNLNGELIGINTAIARQAQGIGFTIPIDTARRLLADLIAKGTTRAGFLGIIPVEVGDSFRRERGRSGVLVLQVEPNSPAAAAGLRMGDVILRLDGVPLSSPAEFFATLDAYPPGSGIGVTVLRGNDSFQRQFVLTEIPAGYGLRYSRERFGIVAGSGREGLRIEEVAPGSPAARAGLQPGDRIAKLGEIELRSLDDYGQAMEKYLGREPLGFVIVRGKRGYLVRLPAE